MAIARTELQVTWSAANSVALNTGNSWAALSDEMTQNTACVQATIQIKADQTTGTPSSGDLIDFYVSASLGDPDGAGSNEFDTSSHDIFLGQIDLNSDDPGIMTVNFPVPVLTFKIRAVGSGLASTDVATISAAVLQLTA